MATSKILIQLDVDAHPSSFDAVVAVDSGVDYLFQYGNIDSENVESLIHGAMFTRGGDALANTAIFIGGSQVAAADKVLSQVLKTFFGPVRVSVLFDANGCNTTAAAAVLSAQRHLEFQGATATVLGATGPVGQRVARLLAALGCHVRLGSRTAARAQQAVHAVGQFVDRDLLEPFAAENEADVAAALAGADAVFACGAAGVQLVSEATWTNVDSLKVAIDLNAVPPAGIESVAVHDRGREVGGCVVYGAIGVGGLKMKIHKAAIAALFEANDRVLDADEVFAIGKKLL